MTDAGEPTPSGQHGLGPHVVGQRVVIRTVVPGETGPTGGPAFTDLLGVCERWSAGEAVVRRSDGTVAIVPTNLIVSGKPVPARASRFERMPRERIDAHLGSSGQAVWLGSVSQLARQLPSPPAESPEAEGPESAGSAYAQRGASARIVDDWVVVDDFTGDAGELVAVVEWAAERGASTLAVTDPRRADLLTECGFVSR